MKTAKILFCAFILGSSACHWACGQDYIAYVEQLSQNLQQQANQSAAQAVYLYRQQTGDYTSSDQEIYNYLVAESRRQNPGWYADLQRREMQFQQQQGAYVQNSNAILDNMYNGYMNRSEVDYQSHQQYVQQGIWERANYTNGNGNVYELPYYQPNTMYEATDGTQFYQDNSGQYYQYDNSGWWSEMDPYGW